MCYMIGTMSWPLVYNAYVSGEVSASAGGLIRWPVYALIPAGFLLLALQGISELIKRLNFLFAQGDDVLAQTGSSEAEMLAKQIAEAEKLAAKTGAR